MQIETGDRFNKRLPGSIKRRTPHGVAWQATFSSLAS
jgi:hypothetical protein